MSAETQEEAMYNALSMLSGALIFMANGIYIVRVWNRETEPVKSSWIMWTILNGALCGQMLWAHTLNGQLIGSTVSSFVVTAFACWGYGTPGWTWVEKTCLAILPFGLAAWWFRPDAGLGISLALVALACWPTYESMFKNPGKESRLAWTIVFIADIVMLSSLQTWNIETAAQPIVFFGTVVPMMYLLWMHPRKK